MIYLFVGESDLDKVFQLPRTTFIGGDGQVLTLREIVQRLEVGDYLINLKDWLALVTAIVGIIMPVARNVGVLLRKATYFYVVV